MAMKALDFYNLTQKYIHSDEHLKQDEETKRKELESFNNHFNNLFDQESADMDDEEFEAYKAQFKPYEANKQISPQGRSHEFARRIQEAKKSEAWENLPDNEKAKYNQVIGQKYRELRLAEGLPIEPVEYDAKADAAQNTVKEWTGIEPQNQPQQVNDLSWKTGAKSVGKSLGRVPGSLVSTGMGAAGFGYDLLGSGLQVLPWQWTKDLGQLSKDTGAVLGTAANAVDTFNRNILPPEQKQSSSVGEWWNDRNAEQKALGILDEAPEQFFTFLLPMLTGHAAAKSAQLAQEGKLGGWLGKLLNRIRTSPKYSKWFKDSASELEKGLVSANRFLSGIDPQKAQKVGTFVGSSAIEASEMAKNAYRNQGEIRSPLNMLAHALVAGKLESLVPEKLGGIFSPQTRALLRRDFGKGAWKSSAHFIKNLGKDTIANLFEEGLTELTQTYVEQSADMYNSKGMTADGIAPVHDAIAVKDILEKDGINGLIKEAGRNERVADIFMATLLGGITGGVGTAMAHPVNYVRYNTSPEGYLDRYRENRENLLNDINNSSLSEDERNQKHQELDRLEDAKNKWELSNPLNSGDGQYTTVMRSLHEMADPETSEDDLKDAIRTLSELNDNELLYYIGRLINAGWKTNDTFNKNLEKLFKYDTVLQNWGERDAISKFLRGEQLTSEEERIVQSALNKYSGQTSDIGGALNQEIDYLNQQPNTLWNPLFSDSNDIQQRTQQVQSGINRFYQPDTQQISQQNTQQTSQQSQQQTHQEPPLVNVNSNNEQNATPQQQQNVQQTQQDPRIQQIQNRIRQLEQQKAKDEQEKEQLRQQLVKQQKNSSNANIQGQPLQNGKRGFIGNEARLKAGDIDTKCNYAVVELSDLQTLTDEENPRQRNDRKAYANTVSERARNLDPDLLIDNSVGAQNGPIVVDQNLKVESGNGRTLSLREAYANRKGEGEYSDTENDAGYGRADLYRNKLIAEASKYGISSEQVMQMKEPVLVRIRVADSNINAKDFWAKANNSQQESMSSTETALVDGEKVKPFLNQFEAIGDIRAKSNLKFVKSFLEKICSPYELNSMFTADGRSLSEAGEKRINNAIIASAYGNSEIVSLLTELGNEEIQTILNGLAMAAPDTAKLMGEVKSGAVHDVDFSKDLVDAIRTIKNIRQNPDMNRLIKQLGSVSEVYLRQGLLGDDGLSPTARLFIGALGNLNNKETICNFLKSVNNAVRAEGNPNQLGMFEANTKPSDEVFVERAIRSTGLEYRNGKSIADDIERLKQGPAHVASNDDFHAEDAQGRRYSESSEDYRTEAERLADDGITATREEFDDLIQNVNDSIDPDAGISFEIYDSVEDFNKGRADNDKAPSNANAFIDKKTGKIVFFRDKLTTLTRLKQVIAHELVGHAGIERLLGGRYYDIFLRSIRKLARRDGRVGKLLAQVKRNYGDFYVPESYQIYEELGAHLAELYARKPESFSDRVGSYIRKLKVMFRNALRNWGVDIEFNQVDLEDIFAKARESVETRNTNKSTNDSGRRYSIGSDGQRMTDPEKDNLSDMWKELEGEDSFEEEFEGEDFATLMDQIDKPRSSVQSPSSDVRYSLANAETLTNSNRNFVNRGSKYSFDLVDKKVKELTDKGKVTEFTEEEINEIAKEMNLKFPDKQGSKILKFILKEALGKENISFNINGNTIQAYITQKGLGHFSRFNELNNANKAFANKMADIINKAEYIYSTNNQVHNNTEKIEYWDDFVAVTKVKDDNYYILFGLRKMKSDKNHQIYALNIKSEDRDRNMQDSQSEATTTYTDLKSSPNPSITENTYNGNQGEDTDINDIPAPRHYSLASDKELKRVSDHISKYFNKNNMTSDEVETAILESVKNNGMNWIKIENYLKGKGLESGDFDDELANMVIEADEAIMENKKLNSKVYQSLKEYYEKNKLEKIANYIAQYNIDPERPGFIKLARDKVLDAINDGLNKYVYGGKYDYTNFLKYIKKRYDLRIPYKQLDKIAEAVYYNPIKKEDSGTIEEWLDRNYDYDKNEDKGRRFSLTNPDESTRDFAQRQADKYNIRSLNDSVNVQKQVLNSLPDSFYKDVFVNSTGDTIRISKKGIKETFAFKNFSRLPRLLKACKLAVLDDLDKLLGSSERYVSDEKNYHAGNKETSFDYFRTPVEVDGKPCIVKFDIKKGKDGKRLYLYRIEIEKQAQLDLLPENGEAQKSSDLSNDNLQQIPETRKFSLSSPVEHTKNLIAVHNLSEQELLDSLKLGGFPMPSIAIVKDSMGHEKYGDISVVFNRDTIDPKKSKYNKVYGGDAYTPTFPKVGYKFNSEKIANINKRIEDILGDELSGVNGLGHSGIDDYNLNSYVQSYGEDLARAYHDNSSLKATFLKEKGIDFDVEYKDSDLNSYFSNDFIIKVLNRLGEGKVRNINLGTEEISDSIIDEIRDMANNEFKNSEDGRKARRILKDYIPYNKSNFGWSKVESIINAANRFLNFGIKKVISNTTKDNINKAVEAHETEYRQWLNNLFDGIIEKKGLRNSKDYYTPNGNPRNFESLYDDFTLNNIVKAMRKEKPKKSIFGSSTSDYSSIDNLKEDSERIKFIEDEEFSKLRSEIQDRFSEIEESLGKNYGASEMLIEAVSKYESKANIERYLARECDKLGIELRSDTVEKLISLRDDIRRLPTGYFEAKPQRAVGLDEVVSVIIPSHSTDRLRNALKEAGIETVEYEIDSDSSDRLKALNNIADNHNIRFSLSSNQKLDLNGEEYSVASIEDSVKDWFYDTFESDMDGLSDTPIDIKNLKVIGSRAKGNYNTDSDLDVVLEYEDPTDSWREDDVFNMLNEVPHELNGVKVDINPIKKEDSGTIEEWLDRNYDYDKNAEDNGRRYSLGSSNNNQNNYYDYSKPFSEQVDDWIAHKISSKDVLLLGGTPKVFRDIGLASLPVTMNQKHLDYAINGTKDIDHHIGEAIVKQLPELIKKPLAIISSESRPNTSVIAILTATHPQTGKNIMFAANIDGISRQNNQDLDSLKISTVFAKPNVFSKLLKDAFEKHLKGNKSVFYLDKQNTINAMAKGGLQLSDINHFNDGVISRLTDFDSPVKPRINSQTETLQFNRWFGKSVMTEDGRAGGKPKVLYHGTDQYGFDVFRDNSFFTDDQQFAKRYEAQRHQDHKPGTYEVYLRIEKPFDIRNPKDRKIFTEYRNGHEPTQTDSGAMEWTDFDYDELTEYLKENYPNKYDGYVIQETYNNSLSYVPFEKSQIKSATDNIGTFDRNNDSIRYSLGSTIEQQRKQFEDYVDGKIGIKLSDDEKDTIKAILETDDDADLDLNDIPTFGERLGNAKESLKTFLGQLITGLIGDTQSRADRKKAPYLWAKDHSTENVVETPYEISRRTKIEQGMKTREEEDRLVLKHLDADKNLFTGLIRKWTKPGALQDWMLKKASRILAPFQIMKPVEQLLFTVAENIMWDEAKQQMVIAPYRDTEYDKQTNRPIGYKYDPNEKNGRLALDIYNNKLNDEFKAIIKERSIANNKFREDFVNRVVPFEQAKLYLARFGRKRLEGASKKIVDGNDQQSYSYITKLKGVIDDLDYNNLISQYDQIKSIPDEQLGRNSAFINSIIGELAGNPAITTNGIDAKLNWLTTNKGLYGYAHHLVSIDPETGNGKPFNALGKISHPWIESIAGDRRGRKGDNSEYRSLLRADLERNRKEAEAEAANRWMEATENTYGITLEEAKNLEKLQKQGKGPGMPEGYEHRHKVIANFGKFRGKVIYLPDETFEAYQMVRDNRSLDSMKQFKEFIQKMNNLNGRINEAMLWHPGKAMRDIMAGPFHLLEFLRDWSMKHPTEINDAAKAIWHGVKNSVSPEYWQSHSPESMGEYSESVIYQTQEGQSPTFGFIDSLFNYFQRAIPVGRTLEAMYKEINFAGGADIPLKRIFTTVGEELADKRGLTGQERERFIYDLVNDYAFDTGDLPEILGWLRGKKPDSKSQALGMISRATVPFMGYATRMIKQMITDPVTKGAIPLAKRAFGNVDSDSNLRSEISEISRPFFWLMLKALIAAGLGGILPPPTAEEIQDMPGVPPSARTHGRFYVGDSDKGERWMSTKGLGQLETAYIMDDYLKGKSDIIDFSQEFITVHPVMKLIANAAGMTSEYDREVPFTAQVGRTLGSLLVPEMTRFGPDIEKLIRSVFKLGISNRKKQNFLNGFLSQFGIPTGQVLVDREGHLRLSDTAIELLKLQGINIREIPFDTIEETARAEASRIANDSKKIEKLKDYRSGKYSPKTEQEFLKQDFGGDFSNVEEAEKAYSNLAERERKLVDTATKLHKKGHWTDLEDIAREKKEAAAEKRKQQNEGKQSRRRPSRRKTSTRPLLNDDLGFINNEIKKNISRKEEYQEFYDRLMQNNKKHNPRRGVAGQLERLLKELK